MYNKTAIHPTPLKKPSLGTKSQMMGTSGWKAWDRKEGRKEGMG